MFDRFSIEERKFILKSHLSSGGNYKAVKIAFKAAFRNRKAPSRNAVKNIAKNFDDHGSVFDAPRSGRPKSSRSAENIELVQRTYEGEPTGLLRRVSNQLGIPYTSLQRILEADRTTVPGRQKRFKPSTTETLNGGANSLNGFCHNTSKINHFQTTLCGQMKRASS